MGNNAKISYVFHLSTLVSNVISNAFKMGSLVSKDRAKLFNLD
jgi:hypothetical protein